MRGLFVSYDTHVRCQGFCVACGCGQWRTQGFPGVGGC